MLPQPNSSPRDGRVPGTIAAFHVFGIPIRLHFTFVLMLVFLVVVGLGGRQSGIINALYILALFGSILFHEIGHALVSRRHGIQTLEVVMFPIGGVARLERNPKPRDELWIALAGPFVNLIISAVVFLYLFWRYTGVAVGNLAQPGDSNLLPRIAVGNLILALFNLLPAYPMDGGRVLRAILGIFKPEHEATRIAAITGRVLAVLMGLYGLLTMQFMLVFVAFFVYVGAAQESLQVSGRTLMRGMTVRAAMETQFRTLSHGDTLREAANLLLATSQQDFPVTHGSTVTGLLSRSALLKGMASEGPEGYVAAVMNRNFVRLSADMELEEAVAAMVGAGTCALVIEEEILVGLLTAENLAEFLVLRRVRLQRVASSER